MRATLGLFALAAACPHAFAQLSGTGNLVSSDGGGGNYVNEVTIQNTGTTTIGTLWLGWIPGQDFLPSQPVFAMGPDGWFGYVVQGIYDSYSVEWFAWDPDARIQPGGSLSGFVFVGPDSPAVLDGLSPQFPRYYCTDSFLYVAGPQTDPGYFLHVTVNAGVGGCGTADFNCDGDVGTDADIESFFACLAGSCPAAPCPSSADFNADGDVGTDADIEAFFRVLAGAAC